MFFLPGGDDDYRHRYHCYCGEEDRALRATVSSGVAITVIVSNT